MDKQLYTIAEAARITGLSEATLRSRIAKRQIEARKIGFAIMIESSVVKSLKDATGCVSQN